MSWAQEPSAPPVDAAYPTERELALARREQELHDKEDAIAAREAAMWRDQAQVQAAENARLKAMMAQHAASHVIQQQPASRYEPPCDDHHGHSPPPCDEHSVLLRNMHDRHDDDDYHHVDPRHAKAHGHEDELAFCENCCYDCCACCDDWHNHDSHH